MESDPSSRSSISGSSAHRTTARESEESVCSGRNAPSLALQSCSVRIDGVFSRLCQHVRQLLTFVLALSPPLPSPRRNVKGSEEIHRTEWSDTRIWSPLLAPPLTIYFIPLGLIFLSIIINKIRTEASS